MKTIKQTYHIKVPIRKVWDCFIDPKKIEAWGGGPAKMSEDEGTDFSLWGGDIFGTTTKIEKEKKITQDWYGGKWDKPSRLTFTFHEEKDGTRVDLLQEGVPEEHHDSIDSGWKDYYLGAIKSYLEGEKKE